MFPLRNKLAIGARLDDTTRPARRHRRRAPRRAAARIADPNADDLDRPGANFDGLAPCCRKPGADEAGDHVAIEQVLRDALRKPGEQLQRAALFSGEVWCSWGRRHWEKPPPG